MDSEVSLREEQAVVDDAVRVEIESLRKLKTGELRTHDIGRYSEKHHLLLIERICFEGSPGACRRKPKGI
jgi:hypothetical protein